MLAIEESTSNCCALEILGTQSIASAVTLWLASVSTSFGLRPGNIREMMTECFLRSADSDEGPVCEGALILRTTSEVPSNRIEEECC
jgi:hypothetical protein